jgi:hypothetical protein
VGERWTCEMAFSVRERNTVGPQEGAPKVYVSRGVTELAGYPSGGVPPLHSLPCAWSECSEYGCHICGEGGEFETITLDAPCFSYGRIVLDHTEVVLHSDDPITPVGLLRIHTFHVERKGTSHETNPARSRSGAFQAGISRDGLNSDT